MTVIDLIVELPDYLKYLLFLAAISGDVLLAEFTKAIFAFFIGAEKANGLSISVTSILVEAINTIFGTHFTLTAPQLLLITLAVGVLLVVLKISGARMKRF